MKAFFFTATLLLTLALLTSGQDCHNGVQQRKEVRMLSDREWRNYVAAVRQIQQPQANGSPYDRLSSIHYSSDRWIHNWPMFLPWHRQFLRSYEILLQRHNPTVTVPYWNWAMDSQAPEMSPIFTDKYFGGNGRSGDNCVTNGSFRGWMPANPRRHCMRRRFNNGDRIGAFHSVEVITRLMNSARDFDSFRRSLEYAPHGTVHNNIGADFATMYSPNDPLFYSHHAFIDKIWADLQKNNRAFARRYDGANPDGTPARLTDIMRPFTLRRVRDVMSTESNCYVYADDSELFGAELVRRSDVPKYKEGSEEFDENYKSDEKEQTKEPEKDDLEDKDESDEKEYQKEPKEPKEPKENEEEEEGKEEEPKEDLKAKKIKADDRSELIKLRTPDPLPDSWCKMNCIPVEEMRKIEKSCDKVTNEYNSKPGYISKCSLWKREDLLDRLSKKGTEFCIEKDGKRVTARGDARKVKSKLGGYA